MRTIYCALCLLLATAAVADDWDLGEERVHSLGLRVGYDEELSKGIDLILTLPFDAELNVDYLQTDFSVEGETESFDKYWVGFSSDPLATWSVQLDYSYSGNGDSVETKDIGIGLQYYAIDWLLRGRYSTGDAEIYARQAAVDSGLVNRPGVEMDRHATELTFQYFLKQWMWTLTGIDYRYSRDIRLNPNNFRVQRVLGPSSFFQLFGLLDRSVTLEAGYQHKKHLWRFGYTDYKLEVSGDSGDSPYISWDYQLTDAVSLGLLGAVELEQSDYYSEASLRYHF